MYHRHFAGLLHHNIAELIAKGLTMLQWATVTLTQHFKRSKKAGLNRRDRQYRVAHGVLNPLWRAL
jgi:hypothetical protein